MTILVNTRLLIARRLDGIGWFTYEVLKRITRQHPEVHFVFAFDRVPPDEFIFSDNVTPVVLSPQARHPLLYYCWFEFSLKKLIHDLNFEHYPASLPFFYRHYYRYFFPRFARQATRLLTVSHFSRQDIILQYKVDPSRIAVAYDAAATHYVPVMDSVKERVKQQYTGGADYWVFVGSLHARKNIARLFEAFDAFRHTISSPWKLVVVGKKYWTDQEIHFAYEKMQFKEDVIFTGWLDPSELHAVMASAQGLTYVPYFEGFGMPVVEAMQCGVPVITSNVTSLPEIAGDAALLVDPFSVSAIQHAMKELYGDSSLRAKLSAMGKERAALFSWDKTAEIVWENMQLV
jgi:glycosyltransferase involved in cell wall biosynthesis